MNKSKWESRICNNQYILAQRLRDLPDITSRNQLEVAFMKLQRTNLEISQQLVDVLIEVKTSQHGTRIASTTGTTLGVIGTAAMVAGVIMAPATAGVSTVFGVGLAASLTSAAATIGTTIYSKVITKKFVDNIEMLQRKQNQASAEVDRKLGIINAIVFELQRAGVQEETAMQLAFSAMRRNIEDLLLGPDGQLSIDKLRTLVREITITLHGCKEACGALAVVYTLTRETELVRQASQALTSMTTKVSEVGSRGVQGGRQLLQTAGQSLTTTTSKVILKRVGAAVGVVFTAIDIGFLVKEWLTPDPLIEHIESVVTVLITDVDNCENMLEIIRLMPSLPSVSI